MKKRREREKRQRRGRRRRFIWRVESRTSDEREGGKPVTMLRGSEFLSQKKPEMMGILLPLCEVGRAADKMPVRADCVKSISPNLSKCQEGDGDGVQAAQVKDKRKWNETEGDDKLMRSNTEQASLNFPDGFLDSLVKEQQAMVENTFNEICQQFHTTKEHVEMIHSKTGELINATVQMEHYWMEQKNELKGKLLQLSNVMDLNN